MTYNDGGFIPGTGGKKTGDGATAKRDTSTNSRRTGAEKSADPNKTAAQLAEDAKNRTIGHYVVGKSFLY